MKLKITLVLLCFMFCGMGLVYLQSQNTTLNIKKTDNTEQTLQLSQLRKITFSGTNLVLNYQQGTTENIDLSLVNKLTFGSVTAVDNVKDAFEGIVVYPNPTSDFIGFKNIDDNTVSVTIYSISGYKVMYAPLIDKKVDIRRLSNGMYLVKVNNQVLKFTKR